MPKSQHTNTIIKVYRFYKELMVFGLHRQLWYLLKSRFYKPPQNIILLYCSGRTGSTLLCESLGNCSYINYYAELLRKPLINYKSFIYGWALKNNQNWLVVKVKPMHLDRMGLSLNQFMSSFNNQNLYPIHLIREDHFLHSISGVIAKERGYYHKRKNDEVKFLKVKIDKAYLEEKIFEKKGQLNLENAEVLTCVQKFRTLSYERDLYTSEKLNKTLANIFSDLEINCKPQASNLNKVIATDLSTEIENWDEIKDLKQKEP